MKAAENQFLPFLEGKKQFVIPIYQRTYSWTREQCEQLWNDIVHTVEDDKIEGHFVGSIVYIQKGLYQNSAIPQLLVIDGQQRLATLSLLLVALAQAAKQATQPLSTSAEEIYDSYLINKHGKDELRYKLLLTQSDKDMLINLVDHLERAETVYETRSLLLENYRFFEERIRQSDVDVDTLYLGISKLIVVDIALDKDHDNPQLIFESLNSTGMDLSQADLIRNYVLMGLDNDEQVSLYKTYWYPMEQSFPYADGTYQFDRFMRDYLTVKQGTIPNIDRVYVSFKTYQRSRMTRPIKEVVADVYRYSRYFVNMAFLREEDHEIRGVLLDINTLKVDVAYPFLLEVYDDYANQRLTREDFVAILKLVESYVFRRVICGVPTNSMNKTFATLAKEIDKEYYLESVQVALLLKDSYRRFPKNEEFRAAFVVKDVYNFRSRNYLLRKLENYDQKELVNVESCTIEHIMPQNEQLSAAWQEELGPNWQEVQAKYLHTIGNLTLTGYNSELSDRSFQEKRDMVGGFAHSPIRLNSGLARLDHWNKEEIEKRAESLAELALKLWPIPQLSSVQVSKYSKHVEEIPSEIIGPIEYPIVGFIPRGFKVVQISRNRFHLYKLINNEWIQYGNGKKPWYAISLKNAGMWARDKQNKNEMPLGVGGMEIYPLLTTDAESGVLVENGQGVDTTGSNGYTVDDYSALQGDMRDVFEHLRKRILNLDSSVREEYKKMYIAYKTTTNFVDIEPQMKRLRLSLNMKFSEINDPKGVCRDLTGIGQYTNGDVEISVTAIDQIDYTMELIHQSFEKHWEEDDV
jgi:uncharacterized protein with ParB-like and HNH nuclease domain/predicted transport protein